jgi:hypothetical protein
MRTADVAAREVAVEASPRRFSMMAIKTAVAGALVEGLEIYDFLVFSFFAVYISHAFFPKRGPTQSFLLTVATLGLGSHQAINALGRIAGRSYCRTEDKFDV